MVGFALLADLGGAPALAARVDKLDTDAVAETDQGRLRQEAIGPVLMGGDEAKESGSLRHVGEQGASDLVDPAVEGALPLAVQDVEQGQGNEFTGPEQGARIFFDIDHSVIDTAEEFDDKIGESHGACSRLSVVTHPIASLVAYC